MKNYDDPYERGGRRHRGAGRGRERRAVRLVVPDSPLADDVADLIDRRITVSAGATCFDALDLPREALPGVGIVPSGVSEVVRLQSEGYNYVRIP
jgi:hypothetical protein